MWRLPLFLMWFAFSPQQPATMPGVENSVGYLSSGTSIEPRTTSESSPMIHGSLGNWLFMFHANVFLNDIQQNKSRGRDKLFSTNWLMPVLQRDFGRQTVTLRTMLSLEPLTITQRRYPLLFQTGETAYGLSIIDGQHPHDLIMELAGRYDFKTGESSQIFAYGGPVAEAALGPTAFMHRSSASENPIAVLAHHQQDSTHIATNVITTGVTVGPFQVEASTFHGREPNENRWNIDTGKPDSFSMRLTAAPGKNLSMQVSSGRINNPEAVDPNLDTVRTTASIHHNVQFASGHLSSSFIWGRNKDLKNGGRRIFNSYNFEMTANFKRRNWVWTRIENLDRDRTLLPVQISTVPVCPRDFPKLLCQVLGYAPAGDFENVSIARSHVVAGPTGPVFVEEEPIGRIQAYTLGYERELPFGPAWLNTGLGFQATTYGMPPQLKAVYGSRPSTLVAFLRFRPSGNMAQQQMKVMHQHP